LPLRHQREPSRCERVQKCIRRNPWLISTGTIALVSTVIIAGLAAAVIVYMNPLVHERRRLERESALTNYADFQTDFKTAQALLYARDTDRKDEEQARAAAQRALDRYGVPSDGAWREQPAVRLLPDEDREHLTGDVGELLVLLAGSLLPDHA